MAKKPPTPTAATPPSGPSDQKGSVGGTAQPSNRLPQDYVEEYTEISWRGPLPPPLALKQINEVVPNGAERLMAQVEAETRHRHTLERRAQIYPFLLHLVVRVSAIMFALASLGVAIYAINANQPWVAAAFGAATVAIGVNAFLRPASTSQKAAEIKKQPPGGRQ